MDFWDALGQLSAGPLVVFALALLVAFAFEFVNGFHDTANAVSTVIYTRSLPATPAVIYSGVLNFVGVLVGGTAVAFTIVNLLPVDLLVHADSSRSLVTVLSILAAGMVWNLGTWFLGLPVSSSHTLIGSILGVGLVHGLMERGDLSGVNWKEVQKVVKALLLSPAIGFAGSALLLLVLKVFVRAPRFYVPPEGDDRPPGWIRGLLVATCGGVSFAHGSNDGQKGMGLVLLVLIGFLPVHYAFTVNHPKGAPDAHRAAGAVREAYAKAGKPMPTFKAQDASFPMENDLARIERDLDGVASFADIPADRDHRWELRQAMVRVNSSLKAEEEKEGYPGELNADVLRGRPAVREAFQHAVEFVPLWVVIGTATALGVGTTVGYKRIVVTIAEKIGKTHLTYAQGAAAQTVAATTILATTLTGLPVSTTQVLSSGVAGTMVANRAGVQSSTAKKILLAWVLTFPGTMLLSAALYRLGRWLV